MLSMAYLRNSGDRVRTHLGHTEYIHEKISQVVRKVPLREEEITVRRGGNTNIYKTLAFDHETNDDVIPKESKAKALKESLAEIVLPDSFAAPCNAAIRCTCLDSANARIIKSFPKKSVRVSFLVDTNNPELASVVAALEKEGD